MKQFAVFKNGCKPSDDEFKDFMEDYLGITQSSPNFQPLLEFEEGKENMMYRLETNLFTESQLDSYSMDWEFIEIKL